jgi:hypothetical protein
VPLDAVITGAPGRARRVEPQRLQPIRFALADDEPVPVGADRDLRRSQRARERPAAVRDGRECATPSDAERRHVRLAAGVEDVHAPVLLVDANRRRAARTDRADHLETTPDAKRGDRVGARVDGVDVVLVVAQLDRFLSSAERA